MVVSIVRSVVAPVVLQSGAAADCSPLGKVPPTVVVAACRYSLVAVADS
jgi:hypothetical protein